MPTSPSKRVNSGLAQILAGILLIIIDIAIIRDPFWALVLLAASFITIMMGIRNIQRARREVIEQGLAKPGPGGP